MTSNSTNRYRIMLSLYENRQSCSCNIASLYIEAAVIYSSKVTTQIEVFILVSKQLIRGNAYVLEMDGNNNNSDKYNLNIQGQFPECPNLQVLPLFDLFRKYQPLHYNVGSITYSNGTNRNKVGLGDRNRAVIGDYGNENGGKCNPSGSYR